MCKLPRVLRHPEHDPGLLELAAIGAERADQLLLGAARDVHRSIAGRVFGAIDSVPGLPNPARLLHNGISAGLYASISLGFGAAGRGLRAADRRGWGPGVDQTAFGRFTRSAVNGLIGDNLVESGSPIALLEPTIQVRNRAVPATPDALQAAFAGATGDIVIFVHGLCESDAYWRRRSRPLRTDGGTAPSYGDRLAQVGWTPIWLRVNTGLAVHESGVGLSALLTRIQQHWPTEVRRIAIVGHSMGGLIARAACNVAVAPDRDWRRRLTDIVTLGTPHFGSPVERGIVRFIGAANRLGETAPAARIFEQRSRGVLDLSRGLPDETGLLDGVNYHLVAATLSHSKRHPIAHTVGDLLVPYRSALGIASDGRRLFTGANTLHVGNADHFDLLNHDAVSEAISGWLAPISASAVGEQPA